MADTPFDLIYAKLTDEILLHADIAPVLKEKNLIDYDQDSSPEKASVQTADLPEIVVYLSHIRGNIHQSSDTAKLTTVWAFMTSVGTYDSSKLNTLSFGLIRILVDWKSLLGGLTWSSRAFVKDVRLVNADVGLSNPKANRNIVGWSSIMMAEIDVSLLLADLKA